MAEKISISASDPCKICGKPDWCYRLYFPETGDTLHCCARISEKGAITSSGSTYVFKKTHETDIGEFAYYQEAEEAAKGREKFLKQLKDGKMVPKIVSQATTNKSENHLLGECEIASSSRLSEVYKDFVKVFPLSIKDKEHLRDEWETKTSVGLTKEILESYPIISIPKDESKRVEAIRKLKTLHGNLRGIPGYYEKDGVGTLSGKEGIAFPIFNKNGELIRYRIRENFPDISGEFAGVKGTYQHRYSKDGSHLWFFVTKESSKLVWASNKKLIVLDKNGLPKGKPSSKYKNLASCFDDKGKNGYQYGTRSGSRVSIYARPGDNFSSVYFTEGEKKAMVANILLKCPAVSLPGTGTFSKLFDASSQEDGISIADYLVSKGMKLAVIAYDADKTNNLLVLKAETKAIEAFKQKKISIAVGEWNPNFGKGLDDILISGVRPSIFICT